MGERSEEEKNRFQCKTERKSGLHIDYLVAMPRPENHRFRVQMTITGWTGPRLTLRLPVWTPGSYMVREFSKHVGRVNWVGPDGPVPIPKQDKATWILDLPGPDARDIVVTYEVYAYELTVRSSHLDATHGYFNGATLFLYVDGCLNRPIRLTIEPPTGWEVATALEAIPEAPAAHTYSAPDYDTLIDSPVEIGRFDLHRFAVREIPHELAIWGGGFLDTTRIIRDLTRIIEETANLFGGTLPYARYLFIVHVTQDAWGGLEHRNSTTIAVPRFADQKPEDYDRMLALFAHEFFHLWNGKRLRPEVLGPFDYQAEVYTPLLWVVEGLTDYYAWLVLSRSRVVPAERVLAHWADSWQRLAATPGQLHQSLSEASFDAWIKYYRPDSDSPNSTVSYYTKGALAGLFLDLSIRRATNGQSSLDTVMARLWREYGETGYPASAVGKALAAIGGPEVKAAMDRYVDGLGPWDETVLAWAGLRLSREFSTPAEARPVDLGLQVNSRHHPLSVQWVRRDGPAEEAGIAPGDEIIALDNIRVDAANWTERLGRYRPTDAIRVTFFRRDLLVSGSVTAGEAEPDRWRLEALPEATGPTVERLRQWLGALPGRTDSAPGCH